MRSHSNPAVDDAPCRKTNSASSSGWLHHGTTMAPPSLQHHHIAPPHALQFVRRLPHGSWHSLLRLFKQCCPYGNKKDTFHFYRILGINKKFHNINMDYNGLLKTIIVNFS